MEWCPVKDYEDLYLVSNMGDIWSIKRKKCLKTSLRHGYISVSLNKNGKGNTLSVHKLVATAFIPPYTGEVVNHLDGDKTNNVVGNLEWTTQVNNAKHAHEELGVKIALTPVLQYSKEGEFIARFQSIKEAERVTGASAKHIPSVCNGKMKSAGGFVWKHETEKVKEPVPKGRSSPDFPNYLITEDGRVYNLRTKRYMKIQPDGDGGSRVLLSNGKKHNVAIHNLVATLYLANEEGKDCILHKNGDKQDNHVQNLEWANMKDIMQDRLVKLGY